MSTSIYIENDKTGESFYTNFTSNFKGMAKKAGLYECIFEIDEDSKPLEIIEQLTYGYRNLVDNSLEIKKYEISNSCGSYDDFVKLVGGFLLACILMPDCRFSIHQ